jgi:hypothetical protein
MFDLCQELCHVDTAPLLKQNFRLCFRQDRKTLTGMDICFQTVIQSTIINPQKFPQYMEVPPNIEGKSAIP